MRRYGYRVLTAVLLALSLVTSAHHAAALERLNIVVLGQDRGGDSLLPESAPFVTALDVLTGQLNRAGFAVFDRAALALGEEPGHNDARLISAARAVTRPPLDLAILVSLSARSESQNYSKRLSSRLDARLLDLGTGRQLGTFQFGDDKPIRLPLSCERSCLRGHLTETAERQARDLAAALIERLSVLDGGHAVARAATVKSSAHTAGYNLVFDGFTDREVTEMEEYLVVFKGYQLHRPIVTTGLRHEFWYETTSPRVRLNRNLIKMLQHLRLSGEVHLAGDAFTLARAPRDGNEQKDWASW